MKKLTAILFLLLLTIATHATSIVIVVTQDYIFMGTDSKRQFVDKDAHLLATQNICKIRRAGAYCFAMAGLTTNPGTAFSAQDIVTAQLQQNRNYRVASQQIRKAIKQALEAALRHMQQRQPLAWQQLCTSGTPLLELAVLSRHQGQPQLEIIGFEAGSKGAVKAGSYATRMVSGQGAAQQIYFMGAYSAMEQQLARKRADAHPEQLIEELISAQAQATPSAVGAPINMVQFGSYGLRWIR